FVNTRAGMLRCVRFRLAELILAVAAVAIALLWAEQMAWQQISSLREQLSPRRLESLLHEAPPEGLTRADVIAAYSRASNDALTRLQRYLFASLLGLLIGGGALVVLVWRRTLAPLRRNLSESRTLLDRQEKLASLGVLAAGIAHEIRNPLTAIKVRLFTLRSAHRPDRSEHEDLEVIRNEIDRLERIVSDFLQFARPTEPELRMVSAASLLDEIRNLLESELAKKSVALEVRAETDACVRVDPARLKQALINFVQNGAESIRGSGTVTRMARLARRTLHGHAGPAVV